MFSFFQTIFHKVTTVIATAAIAIGFISAPKPPEQPILDNQNPIVVEQQIEIPEIQKNAKSTRPETDSSIEKLKAEIENLRKSVVNQNKPKSDTPKTAETPIVQSQPQIQQPSRTVPPRPENSDDWTFNWNNWAWEKHPSPPPIAPTINTSLPNNELDQNQQSIIQNYYVVNMPQPINKKASVVLTACTGGGSSGGCVKGINTDSNRKQIRIYEPIPYKIDPVILSVSGRQILTININFNNPDDDNPPFSCEKSGNRYWQELITPKDHNETPISYKNFDGSIESWNLIRPNIYTFTVSCNNNVDGSVSTDTVYVQATP